MRFDIFSDLRSELKSLKFFLISLSLVACTNPSVRAAEPTQDQAAVHTFYRKIFSDSLHFFDGQFRLATNGQYFDAINLDDSGEGESSSSATGMGLVSLAIGDATKTIPDAHTKAVQTLALLLHDPKGTAGFTKRSKAGWYRHWYDIHSGANTPGSEGDGYSTVDTAILAAGAVFAANYFESAGEDPDHSLRNLANELLLSVNWASAISNGDAGTMVLKYDLHNEQPIGATAVFNEYTLVACMGAYAESVNKSVGPMTHFWTQHYSNLETLPHAQYQGLELLADSPGYSQSSFVIQFATYLCSDVGSNPAFLKYFSSAQKADQLWFQKTGAPSHFWGLGAGEVRYREAGETRAAYHADSIDNDPHLDVSPSVIAGFLPVHHDGLLDLMELYSKNECVYHYHGYDLLWRCSLEDPAMSMSRVQAVDYAMMFMGLATLNGNIEGLGFFQKNAPGRAHTLSPVP